MPPKIKITKEEIMNGAICIVREEGFERLNARDLAKRIGCSVHPIFREYSSMDALKNEVYKTAEEIYNKRMLSTIENSTEGFLNMGLAYINFAKTEKYLFQLLFMSDAFQENSIMDIVGTTEGDDEVIQMICQSTGLKNQSAKELYTGIWLTTHGIASMLATNNCGFSAKEIKRLLSNSYFGLLEMLQREEEKGYE